MNAPAPALRPVWSLRHKRTGHWLIELTMASPGRTEVRYSADEVRTLPFRDFATAWDTLKASGLEDQLEAVERFIP